MVSAPRRKFDSACELMRHWSRPLVGQTLWNHAEDAAKDLRMMVLDPDAEIPAATSEDDGYLLDPLTGEDHAELIVIDAKTMTEPAGLHLPQRDPSESMPPGSTPRRSTA